jgi:hypothetical protein
VSNGQLKVGGSRRSVLRNPVRGSFLSSTHLSPILLLNLLVLSTHVLWAQRTSPLEESAVQLPDAPHVHLTYKRLPLTFKQNQGQAESWMRFFPDHTSYDRLLINTNAVLGQNTAEFWGKNRFFPRSASTKWMTFAPAYGQVHHETIHGANDLDYYGHHIPWAGSIVLRVGQQAKAHRHITSVLKMVQPRF